MLTPFVFKKIESEFKLREKVIIVSKSNGNSVIETQSGYIVTKESCTCHFFTAMKLPCKHIFKFLEESVLHLYVPTLCCVRWTKDYYHKSHPALSAYENINVTEPISVREVRVPSEIDKYKKMSNMSKEICNLGASMSTGEYQYYMEKMAALKEEMNASHMQNQEVSHAPVPNPHASTPTTVALMPNPIDSTSDSNIMLNPVAIPDANILTLNSVASTSNSNVVVSDASILNPVPSTSLRIFQC